MNDLKVNPEDRERKLIEHIAEEVANGISGRDGEEIVDVSPSRVLFAGVLQAPRDLDAMNSGSGAVEPPPDSSLGLDFKIGTNKAALLRLTITARWSLYYPVFPTLEQTVRANASAVDSTAESVPVASDPEKDGDVSSRLPGTESSPLEPDEASDPEVQSETRPIGRVVLPRVFRRHDIIADPVSIDVPINVTETRQLGATELAAALAKARATMQADERAWRHLGEPSDAERELGDLGTIASAEAYLKALSGKSGTSVKLPPWSLAMQVDVSPDPGRSDACRIRVLFSNTTSGEFEAETDRLLEERSIFDAQVTVEIAGGDLLPFDFLLAPKDYRSKPTMPARGINCTAYLNESKPNELRTETLPLFRQPHYRTRTGADIPFAKLDVDDPTLELEIVATEMDAYVKDWDAFLSGPVAGKWTPAELKACTQDREAFKREIEGYRLGVETLRRDPMLAEAFRLMNRAFDKLGKSSSGRLHSWRLFQIGFIVSQLPSLAVREIDKSASDPYSVALHELLKEVGVLWFPTGGGKTESYLGLIAVALIYDRLRGKTSGVCAWMRFPLRMLSLQQLERLARVIAALNVLRSEYPRIAGGDPFAIGFYVGDSVTPNSLSDDQMRNLELDQSSRDDRLLLRKCPFCGEEVKIKAVRNTWRLAHVCSNDKCFSNTSSSLGVYKGSLPLCITDTEIYRYLPSVLVGTIDKLAILARNRYFSHIVRGAPQKCPIHGYTSYDACIEGAPWAAKCTISKSKLHKVAPVRDPGPSLLIQDEFHLLRAELGVFNGHYEGLLQYLGEKAFMRPKVLAATATIEAYDAHTFHVYLARSRRYPQPAWEAGESFYATSKPLLQRRFYLGILNHTRAIEDSAMRAMCLYIRAIRRLKSQPRKAAVIMDMPQSSDAEVLAILRLYDLSLSYVNRKATGGSLSDKMALIEKFLERETLGSITHRVLTGDQPADYIGDTLDLIERQRAETAEPRLDVVIATNLISHGVDLERINMMTVCGMPSHYAEYVQTTSRAARSHPGLVFVCFKSRDAREHSQFEFFTQMHEHMERLIEAVAVNRFASFAPRKTVPGILAGLLLCDYSPRLYGKDIGKSLDHIPTLQIALGFKPSTSSNTAGCITVAELRQAIERIIGVDKIYPPASEAQVLNVRQRLVEAFDDQMGIIGRTHESKLADAINPLTSFRDVDEGIDFGSKDSSTLVGRMRTK